MSIEISFPRGGRKPPKYSEPKVSKVQYDLFGKKKPKYRNRDLRNEMGLKNPIQKDVCPAEISKTTADLLSYKSVQEGMVILGSIREIQKMTLSVLLPGRISGRVMITQVSLPYRKLLQSIAANNTPQEFHQLKDLFHPGQNVVTKVVKINSEDEKCQINLSLTPQDVNSELNYQSVSTGMLLWGAVSDCEEHGYVIDLGIKNCRSFLPKANVDEDKKYYVGQLLWCTVEKYNISGTASTATLNTKREKVLSEKVAKDTSLNYLQPGMQVNFTVSNILNNGLEGKFLNDFIGYIHEGYLRSALDNLDKYKIGQTFKARILYIEPITKLTYLSLKGFNSPEKLELCEGFAVTCTISSIARSGLYVKIGKNHKGFVSFKRLKKPLSMTSDLDYNEQVKKNYKKGSQHQCRILSYDYMEQIYICTMEKDLIKQNVFSYKDLKLGQTVSAEIREVQKNGLFVQVGRVTGFILNEHLSDSSLSSYDIVKKKYSVGQKLKAKVWNINEESSSLLLTLKPSLLSTENCLTSYEEAEYNKQFPGIIVQITKNGLLVAFFGNVKGWVPKHLLSFEKVDRPELIFKLGQIVNCTIIKSNPNVRKLSLSLQPPKAISKKHQLKLGQHVDVKITEVSPESLVVEVIDTKAKAIIPSHYLTEHPSLAKLVLQTFFVNDIIKNAVVICIHMRHGVPLLSLRDSDLNENDIKTLDDIQVNSILKCSVHCLTKVKALLSCAIKDFNDFISVPNEKVCEIAKNPHVLGIKNFQRIYAQVVSVKKNKGKILASTELSKVWDGDLTESKKLLLNYLSSIAQIREHWIKQRRSLTKYKLGDSVKGIVTNIDNNEITIKLEHDVIGKVSMQHTLEGLSVGDEIKATVLWLNFEESCLELTLKSNYISRINKNQDGSVNIKIGKNVSGDILLVKKEFVLVSLRGNGNRQLAFLPVQLHANDLKPNTHCYNIGDQIKIQILHIDSENKQIVGISKELLKNFEKARKAMKRARKSSDSSDSGISVKKARKESSDDNKLKLTQTENKKRKIVEAEKPAKVKKAKINQEEIASSATKNRKNLIAEEEVKNEDSANEIESEEENDEEERDNDVSDNSDSQQEEESDIDEKCSLEEDLDEDNPEEEEIETDDVDENGESKDNLENESDESDVEEKGSRLEEVDESTESDIEESNSEIEDSQSKDSKEDNSESENMDDSGNKLKIEQKDVNIFKDRKQTKTKESTEDHKEKKDSKKLPKVNRKTLEKNIIENDENTLLDKESITCKKTTVKPILSGVAGFWDAPTIEKPAEESSEDDEKDEVELTKKQKKKKLTAAEKAEEARNEEERLRKIETELADQESAPKTADQFDRLVLANPNSSMLWINYMAFHLEATEIEKARAVARKALKTIEFREEQEKLNVWIAFLNLENRYGSKESFLNILEEAVKMNDALTVHLQALHILAESNKVNEFLQLLTVVTRRYKQHDKMWLSAADACYKCEQKDQARNIMQRAIKTLEDKSPEAKAKQDISLIVQFAIMEAKWGESERAEAILEKVLASYPSRVDVWCSYVDMLVKASRIHVARNVLERAVSQKIRPKKMKTLFKKFVKFEQDRGDEEHVKKVRQLASDYAKEVTE